MHCLPPPSAAVPPPSAEWLCPSPSPSSCFRPLPSLLLVFFFFFLDLSLPPSPSLSSSSSSPSLRRFHLFCAYLLYPLLCQCNTCTPKPLPLLCNDVFHSTFFFMMNPIRAMAVFALEHVSEQGTTFNSCAWSMSGFTLIAKSNRVTLDNSVDCL